nr:hypothetical protein [Tanacetum cinerariifolium]
MSSPGQIRIAHHRRISGGASTCEMISLDGTTTADGAGGMGAVENSGVEVVGATDTRGSELSDGSVSDDE